MKWYYSEKLQLYISLEPLKINNQVFRVAQKHHITLDWDDYGNVVMLDFAEFKTLVRELGGVILSPTEFWELYNEACEKGCRELIQSMMSEQFTEVLDRVYVDDNTYIDHCEVVGQQVYEGNRVTYEPVIGRPGWIVFEDIDVNTGHPRRAYEDNSHNPQMKYWSPDLNNTDGKKTIAIRGYVTSVALPSLDLGIPVDSKQPKLRVRFCTATKPKELVAKQVRETGSFLSYEDFKQYIMRNQRIPIL